MRFLNEGPLAPSVLASPLFVYATVRSFDRPLLAMALQLSVEEAASRGRFDRNHSAFFRLISLHNYRKCYRISFE